MANSEIKHLNNFTGSSISTSGTLGGKRKEMEAKAKAGKGFGAGMTPKLQKQKTDAARGISRKKGVQPGLYAKHKTTKTTPRRGQEADPKLVRRRGR